MKLGRGESWTVGHGRAEARNADYKAANVDWFVSSNARQSRNQVTDLLRIEETGRNG